MDWWAVSQGLAAAGGTLPDVNPYPNFPHSITAPAFVVVELTGEIPGFYAERIRATVAVITGNVDDEAAARDLYDYARLSGDRSLWRALEADPTLGGVCTDLTVVTRRVPRVLPIGKTDYWALEVVAEIDGEGETGEHT